MKCITPNNFILILIGIVLFSATYKISELVIVNNSGSLTLLGISIFTVLAYFTYVFRKVIFVRNLCMFLSSILLAIIFIESLLIHNQKKSEDIKFVFDPNIQAHRKHEFLGAIPVENNQYYRAKYFKDELIYDVKYTIDEHGMRASPPVVNDKIKGKVIFFGCSFTYGEGIQDDETTPYQVGILSGGSYQIYNMGFSGYGPHQMLSALEHGRVEKIVGRNKLPKTFIYQSIYDQIRRTFRPAIWDYFAPRYVINNNGEIIFTGSFLDNSIFSIDTIKTLRRSMIYRKIHDENRKVNNSNINLFIKIISKSRDKTQEFFPGSKFYIVHWDNASVKYEQAVLSGYQNHNLNYYLVSNIIEDYKTNRKEYHISQHDPHPNAKAHKRIAEYVNEKILINSDI